MPQAGKTMTSRGAAQVLEEEIREGKWTPGSPFYTTKEVASRFGVSVLTADRALGRLVQRHLVFRVKGSGTFVSEDVLSRQLLIGVGAELQAGIDPRVSLALYERQNQVMASQLTDAGHRLCSLALRECQEIEALRVACEGADGLLLSRRYLNDDTLLVLEAFGKPILFFGHEEIFDFPFHQVVIDLNPGIRSAVRHLRAAGAERVVIVSRLSYTHNTRREMWRRWLLHGGFTEQQIVDEVHEDTLGDVGRLTGQFVARRLLAGADCRTAMVATGDFIGYGIIDVARERGLKLGDDFLLVGSDDTEGHGLVPFEEPCLASVHSPRLEMALKAAQVMPRLIEEDDGAQLVFRVPSHYVPRQSMGANERK